MKHRTMSEGLRITLKKAMTDSVAAYNAAVMLEQDHRGQAAVQFFCQRSADDGYVPGLLKLAGMYLSGCYLRRTGGDTCLHIKDDVKAYHLISDAAAKQDPIALYMLARCHMDGIGTQRDKSLAEYYLDQVILSNYPMMVLESEEMLLFGCNSAAVQKYVAGHRKHLPPAA